MEIVMIVFLFTIWMISSNDTAKVEKELDVLEAELRDEIDKANKANKSRKGMYLGLK